MGEESKLWLSLQCLGALAFILYAGAWVYACYLIAEEMNSFVRTKPEDRPKPEIKDTRPDISSCYEYYQDGTGRWTTCIMNPEFRREL